MTPYEAYQQQQQAKQPLVTPPKPSILCTVFKGVDKATYGMTPVATGLGFDPANPSTRPEPETRPLPTGEEDKRYPNADKSLLGRILTGGIEGLSNPGTYAGSFGAKTGLQTIGPILSGIASNVVSSAVDPEKHPWLAPASGLATGVLTGKIGNTTQQTTNLGKDEFTQANARLGLPNASKAEATLSPKNVSDYGYLRGSPNGREALTTAAQERNDAAEKVLQGLTPGATTVEGAGAKLVEGGANRQAALKLQNTDWANKLQKIKDTDEADAGPYQAALGKVLGDVSPSGQPAVQPVQSSLASRLLDGLHESLQRAEDAGFAPGTMLGDDLKVLRTQIGGQLEGAIMRGDGTTQGQLKTLYRGLSDSLRSQYTPLGQQAWDAIMHEEERGFSELENVVAPLTREGITPEKIYQWVGNEAKLGSTKLSQVRSAVGEDAWNTYAGTFLRNLGNDNRGEFSLDTFATKWNQLSKNSDTVIQAMFKGTPYGELPQAYKDLALVANRAQQSKAYYNHSESGNTINIAGRLRDKIMGITQAATSGIMGAAAGIGGHAATGCYGSAGMGAVVAGRMGSHVGQAIGGSVADRVEKSMAYFMTNPIAVKWAAAEVDNKMFPGYATWLTSYLNSNDPHALPAAQWLISQISGSGNQQKANTQIGVNQSGNQFGQRPNQGIMDPATAIKAAKDQGFADGGYAQWECQAQGTAYLDGGPVYGNGDTRSRGRQEITNNQYAEGGAVGDDYNTQLSPKEEDDFRKWKATNAPNDSGADYDLRGAFKAGLSRDSTSNHFSDEFKKPNHPTFSDQSKYSKEHPDLPAGHWGGKDEDVYQPPANYADGGEVVGAAVNAPNLPTEDDNYLFNTQAQLSQLKKQEVKDKKDKPASAYPVTAASGGLMTTHKPPSEKSTLTQQKKDPLQQYPMGYAQGGNIKKPSLIQLLYANQAPTGYVGGGSVWDNQNPNGGLGYAQGGQIRDDPRPFYNCQLPRVSGGGWAGGGPVKGFGGSMSQEYGAHDIIPPNVTDPSFDPSFEKKPPVPDKTEKNPKELAGGGPVGSPRMSGQTEISYSEGGPVSLLDQIRCP